MIRAFYTQPFPKLAVDDDFYLREQRLEDTADFFKYYTHPEVARHILATSPQTHEDARKEIQACQNLFRQKQGIYWSLMSKADGLMIGAIGLYINNLHHRAEICYDLSHDYWGKGIMTTALKHVVNFAFEQIKVERIEALTTQTNAASIALLKKLGFTREGTLKHYRYFKGRSHDVEMYALINDKTQ